MKQSRCIIRNSVEVARDEVVTWDVSMVALVDAKETEDMCSAGGSSC